MSYQHPHLEKFDFRYPGEVAREYVMKNAMDRTSKLAELPRLNGVCSWCNVMPTPPKRKYCDDTCRDSANMYCFPQCNATKMFVLTQLQDNTCPGCGEIFDKEIEERIFSLVTHYRRHDPNFKTVSLGRLGYGTGEIWHVDHVIPIFRGGQGPGLENVQVLCVPCHKKKTARERKN